MSKQREYTYLVLKFKDALREHFTSAHYVKIPATKFSILPYDMYVLHNRVFRAIEFKIDDNKPVPHQIMNLNEVAANGGQAWTVTKKDNEVTALLLNSGQSWHFTRKTTGSLVVASTCIHIMNYRLTAVEEAIRETIKRNILEG